MKVNRQQQYVWRLCVKSILKVKKRKNGTLNDHQTNNSIFLHNSQMPERIEE